MDWFNFLANIVDEELLYNRNLALDHLRAFSVSEVSNVSRAKRFSWICFNMSPEGDWLCLWYSLSRSLVRVFMSVSFILFLVAAILIRWPLMTALWAIHRDVGRMSGEELSVKYSSILDVSWWIFRWSVNNASLMRHLCGVLARPIFEVVNETIWWSDQGQECMSDFDELATRIGVQKM